MKMKIKMTYTNTKMIQKKILSVKMPRTSNMRATPIIKNTMCAI